MPRLPAGTLLNCRNVMRSLAIAVVLLAIPVFAVSLFLPVYTDEIIWKILLGRYHLDGMQETMLHLMPSCGIYAKDVPALLLPFRLLNSWLYDGLDGPLAIRAFGVVLEIAWLATAWLLLRKIAAPRLGSGTIAVGLVTLATLGIMPFLLVLSRPEQPLLIGMTILFLPLLGEVPARLPSRVNAAIRGAAIVGGVCFLLATHPRATLALPLAFVFAYRMVRNPWITGACILAISGFAAVAYGDWAARWACPDDPVISAFMRRLTLGANTSPADLSRYLHELRNSFESVDAFFIGSIIPREHYASDLVPPFASPLAPWLARILYMFLSYSVLAGAAAFVFCVLRRWREPGLRVTLPALAAIWLFCLASVASRINKQGYEAALMVPVFAMATFGSLWTAWPVLATTSGDVLLRRAAWTLCFVALVLSVLSQASFLIAYMPYAFETWSDPGYPKGQPVSVSSFGYERLRPKILETAALCGISPASHPRHLVVDELTYFAFASTEQPFFMTYLSENRWIHHRPDPVGIPRQGRSAGIIVGCQWVPSALRSKAVTNGAFCCLPPSE